MFNFHQQRLFGAAMFWNIMCVNDNFAPHANKNQKRRGFKLQHNDRNKKGKTMNLA